MRREVKIGIFLTGTLVILAVFILVLGDLSRLFKKPGYPVSVLFPSATGLEKGAAVRLAGVKIGYVKDIQLAERKAKLIMSISPNYQIPKGSKAALSSLGLLGERFLEVTPSDAPDFCQPGDTLETAPSVSFDQLGSLVLSIGEEIKEVSHSLREITGEESKAKLQKTFQNLSVFSEDLNKFMGDNKDDLRAGIHSASQAAQKLDKKLEDVSRNVDETINIVKGVAQENKETVKSSLEKVKDLLLKLEESIRSLSESLEKINKGEGTVGKLIQDPQLYEDAREALGSVKKTIDPLNQMRATGSFRADYLGETRKVKTFINLGFSLSSKYFLLAQVVEDPILKKFTYSAQGGVRFGAIAPRAGIIESKFGAGVDYLAFNDRLIFSLEGYDFQRGIGPRFRFTSHFSIVKYFYLLAGIDDFGRSSKREIFFGLGLGTR
jgi:phospholipid/cholesterol/gamma-HCH transport system substrate-binding protein